ncbi:MAG: DUF4406 domain-containing protein [Plesiomonas shigelloides]
MKIYIAGPMTGYENFNREEFNSAAKRISDAGNVALNPAILPDGLTQAEYMSICLQMVQISDVVVMLKGWLKSEGARIEHDLAKKCGKEVRYL